MAERRFHEQEHIVGEMDDRLAVGAEVPQRTRGSNGQNTSSDSPQRTPIAPQLTAPSLPVVVTTVSIRGVIGGDASGSADKAEELLSRARVCAASRAGRR